VNRELLWLQRVRDVAQDLAEETELAALLPRIVSAAMEITEAERGYLVRVTGRKPDGSARCRVEAAEGFHRAGLESLAGEVSRTVVERVLDSGLGLVTTREEDSAVLNASSVQARNVVAIICVPLRLRGEVRGVLYLDHRSNLEAFSVGDLPVLRTFADQAALAIETAELRADKARLGAALAELEALRAAPPERVGPGARYAFGSFVGSSPTLCALYEEIERAARSWDPVLVIGESGTGKHLVAREIHARSSPQAPFVVHSCTKVDPDRLGESLFGGGEAEPCLTAAGGGTLVLADFAELPSRHQGRLADVLRDRTLDGAPLRCRVVALTRDPDLRSRVGAGGLSPALYYRLDVQRVAVPALRDHPEDLPALIRHFTLVHRGATLNLTKNALSLLEQYAWPGNVLELSNEVRRLVSQGHVEVSARQLSPEIREGRGVSRGGGDTAGKTLGQVERSMLEAALAAANGNKARAARQLGIPRSTLYGLIQRYGL
jgi:DNA-binding NtrC family response regulator